MRDDFDEDEDERSYDAEDDDMCADCGRLGSMMDECGCCGAPMCGGCFEMGCGVCKGPHK